MREKNIEEKKADFLDQLYHNLIHACKKARSASKYFSKKGTQNHIVLKAKGKVTVLTGLIIELEDKLGYRIRGERYIDTIKNKPKPELSCNSG